MTTMPAQKLPENSKTPKTEILSAGVIPVWRPANKTESDWYFLLLRAYNYWDFPKGAVEKNEDPWQAALRELREETSISQISAQWGKDFYETAPYSHNKTARYYLGEVLRPVVRLLPNPESGRIEHHEYQWLEYDEARSLLVPRVQAVLDWARKRLTQGQLRE